MGQERGESVGLVTFTVQRDILIAVRMVERLDWRLHAGTLLWEWGILAWGSIEWAVGRGESMRL